MTALIPWPVLDLPEVFHVGSMDVSRKGKTHNSQSLEGAGLSVSLHPCAWRKIARLGNSPTWYLSYRGDGRGDDGAALFLDTHALDAHHWSTVTQWAVDFGLLEPAELVELTWTDNESGSQMAALYDAANATKRLAIQVEFENLLELDETAGSQSVSGWRATRALEKYVGFTIDVGLSLNMALTAFAEIVLLPAHGILGVWWQDDLDETAYSAPRGVILPKALGMWRPCQLDGPLPRLRLDTTAGFTGALSSVKDYLYSLMLNASDCGPFDGCCVVFARALQDVIGGDLVVVTRPDGFAVHAGVMCDGKIYDFDGPLLPAYFVSRFARNECVDVTAWRLMEGGDLVEAIRDVDLQARLEKALAVELGAYSACNLGETEICSPS